MINPAQMNQQEIKNLIFDFYLFFSTFEYVIKNRGFLELGEDASPHWDKFINEIKKELPLQIEETQEDRCLFQACKYMMEHPPKKQIQLNGILDYRDIQERNFDGKIYWNELFGHLRRVRNNLFHGEKEPFNSHRDVKLIWSSLEIMKYVSLKETPFKEMFKERFTRFDQHYYTELKQSMKAGC